MSCDNAAIRVEKVCKCYHIYDKPRDRLLQMLTLGRRRLFREFWAVRDVSFEVTKGETIGIVGRNGSGKSTLLQMICGTLNPTSGSISTEGRIAALLELGSGFNPDFTGRENAYLNGMVIGLTEEEVASRFSEIEAFAEIGDFIDQPVKMYSSGMYVRLAFAVQVCVDPDILVIDEALAVGDAYFVQRCYHRLRMLKERGKTILFVSHDTCAVKEICDRALWIEDGQLQMEGDPDRVVSYYRAHLFGTPVQDDPEQQAGEDQAQGNAGEAESPGILAPRLETVIPNVDWRLGSQRCQLIGVALYDGSGSRQITEAEQGADIVLRISVVNRSLEAGAPLIIGYTIRNPRGEEICAMNTKMEEVDIPAPKAGQAMTLRIRISLPVLHFGDYSISPAVATEVNSEIVIEDRVENALVFKVLSGMHVYALMRFPSEFSVEYSEAMT